MSAQKLTYRFTWSGESILKFWNPRCKSLKIDIQLDKE